jgi:hypothetical protein
MFHLEKDAMNVGSHLAELEQKHRKLEAQVEEELHHPGTDSLKIAQLKRLKLQVKDEIARLQQDDA